MYQYRELNWDARGGRASWVGKWGERWASSADRMDTYTFGTQRRGDRAIGPYDYIVVGRLRRKSDAVSDRPRYRIVAIFAWLESPRLLRWGLLKVRVYQSNPKAIAELKFALRRTFVQQKEKNVPEWLITLLGRLQGVWHGMVDIWIMY